MVSYESNELREILLDRQRFADLASHFVQKSSKMHPSESGEQEFGSYLEAGLNILLRENLDLVFRLTESPIETIFVNSLVLGFIKNEPLGLVIQHSVKDAPRQIQDFRDRRTKFKRFMAWYVAEHNDFAGAPDYLTAELERGAMKPAEHAYLCRHFVLYYLLGLEDRFHLILQPGIPDIQVEGRTIRPDMMFWVPTDESIKIVVECDGYEYHKAKTVFVRDRKRDRALKLEGYEVLRFSGTEIYNDPFGSSAELLDHLLARNISTD